MGRLYNLVKQSWSYQSLSQVLDGYRYSVDKKQIQRERYTQACQQLTPLMLRPVGSPPVPLTHCDNYHWIDILRLQSQCTRLAQLRQQVASRNDCHYTMVKITCGPAVSNSRWREIKFSISRNSFESRVSLTSLISAAIWNKPISVFLYAGSMTH